MRRLLVRVALGSIAIGLLAFSVTDLLWAILSYETLEAARQATPYANWRTSEVPSVPLLSTLDVLGIGGMILLIVMAISRTLPLERRTQVLVAISILLASFIASFGRRFIDGTHDHEGAWGALQVGMVSLVVLTLVWHDHLARLLAFGGGIVLTFRQPAIWRASEEYVRASGDFTLAYGAELWKLAAHTIGATGAILIAMALIVAATRRRTTGARDAQAAAQHQATPPDTDPRADLHPT